MSSDDKIMEGGGEGSSHDTHQAITCTIHIMAPTDLGTNAIDSALVASVEAQDTRQESDSSLLVVPADGDDAINVSAKNIIQTVTETNIGSVDLPVISNINSDQVSEQSIELITKDEKHVEDIEEDIGCHCLICNEELQEQDNISVFKSFTTTSQRKVSIFLGDLVGQKLTSRKTHSTIICDKCFKLLNKLDLLEFEIQETKEEIITKYQETIAAYGGRARRKKPAAAKKSDYVFPKIEPEEEDKEGIEIEGDEIYQPQVDDLLEEEQDRREDRDSLDEEWEPEVKRARIKKESTADPSGPPKRKRGRPRKDASKTKERELELVDLDFKWLHKREDPEATSEDIHKLLGSVPELCRYFTSCQNDWGQIIITCVCNKTFLNGKDFVNHICNLKCYQCQHEVNSIITFIHHVRNCNSDMEEIGEVDATDVWKSQSLDLLCKYCSLIFQRRNDYVLHVKDHVNNCLKLYALLLKEKGIAETPTAQPPIKRGRPRKTSNCTICGVLYASLKDLIKHTRLKHWDTLPHACRLCDERFSDHHDLEHHIVEHFLGSYACKICSIHFGAKYPFLTHMESHHPGDFLLKCEFCEFTTNQFRVYRDHRKSPHKAVKDTTEAHVCQYCTEIMPPEEADEHLAEHQDAEEPVPVKNSDACSKKYYRGRKRRSKRKPFSCDACDLDFSCAAALSRHNHAQHPEKYAQKCEICSLCFKGARALELHIDGHENGKCWCPICKLKFRHREHVDQHIQKSHVDIKSIDCEYCNIQVGSYSKYIYHCRTSHASLLEDKDEFKCDLCDTVLENKLLLRKHKMNKHGIRQNTKYKCSVCQKYYLNLSSHMNLHTRAVQYPCRKCDEVFFLKSSLLGHYKLRHSLEAKTQHICSVCDKGFVSKSLLRIHYDREHLHKRLFCDICGNSYKNKSALTYHIKWHRGERPFKCKECGQGFLRPSVLKSHMESIHRLPYTYVYRKPQRQKVPNLVKVEEGKECTILSSSNPSSSNAELELSKSLLINSENSDTIAVKARMDLMDGVVDVGGDCVENVKVDLNDSEIVTVVENLADLPDIYKDDEVYIIEVIDD
ncbi:zinc finger protein Xfin-like isoform X1 [Macrobrachium nipponense]|uniref:zinc finger protein Xfin-like isoform X1 n=1 Tax=Macrobrachium nipponense TaxID=159736 RepID=UPI0030C8B8A0